MYIDSMQNVFRLYNTRMYHIYVYIKCGTHTPAMMYMYTHDLFLSTYAYIQSNSILSNWQIWYRVCNSLRMLGLSESMSYVPVLCLSCTWRTMYIYVLHFYYIWCMLCNVPPLVAPVCGVVVKLAQPKPSWFTITKWMPELSTGTLSQFTGTILSQFTATIFSIFECIHI